MRHEMLTQRAPFCIGAMAKKGTLSQHFVTHVVPPLGNPFSYIGEGLGQPASRRLILLLYRSPMGRIVTKSASLRAPILAFLALSPALQPT